MELTHTPVLLKEAIEALNIKENGIYVDCTLGGAGHSSEILRRLKNGKLYGFDQDDFAISKATKVLSAINDNWEIIHDNFANVKKDLNDRGVAKVDGILYDLGVSSFQFDDKDRGFSYNKDSKLDMRMDTNQSLTAFDIVNYYSLEELKRIFYTYGEEKFSSSIAKKIIKFREDKKINTTLELAEIVKSAVPAYARREKNPSRKIFQALRIAVNDELNILEQSLNDAMSLLNKGGRIVVIDFQSLEDKICKQTFKNSIEENIPRGVPVRDCDIVRNYKLITKKPIIPTEEEIKRNNRSRSAKMRVLEKI
ncbi:MAG: 16S rRNA (cytosine(1402)-N(4))-methyltransferase RsmH [Bacilli bacterium]